MILGARWSFALAALGRTAIHAAAAVCGLSAAEFFRLDATGTSLQPGSNPFALKLGAASGPLRNSINFPAVAAD
jgi:hypothetical protein